MAISKELSNLTVPPGHFQDYKISRFSIISSPFTWNTRNTGIVNHG